MVQRFTNPDGPTISTATGRVIETVYHDRLPTTPRGDVRVSFDDFRAVGELRLAFRSVTILDARPPIDRTWSSIQGLSAEDAGRFVLPLPD